MKNEYLSISKVIDLGKWQSLQDSLALVTKMAIITIDFKGTPVTAHSSCRDFCKSVRNDSDLSRYCEKCDSRGGLEAVRLNKPYMYLCHYNIVDVAIPIIVDDKYIGAIMAGQIKLPENEETGNLEQIITGNSKSLNSDKFNLLKDQYDGLPILSYDEISTACDMLFSLSTYIVEEAMDKNLIAEMYNKALSYGIKSIDSDTLSGYSLKNIQDVKTEMSNTLLNSLVKGSSLHGDLPTNPILKPAFEYILNHKSEKISQKKIAVLCHISTSYLSRLFSKETGESFSSYLSRMKIEWAKQLLESTDMPVSQIGDELGFNEAGYFIKTFKKQEGITPSCYRKYYKKS